MQSESQLGADQESTPGPATGVLMTTFLQVLLELNDSFIYKTFKLNSLPNFPIAKTPLAYSLHRSSLAMATFQYS